MTTPTYSYDEKKKVWSENITSTQTSHATSIAYGTAKTDYPKYDINQAYNETFKLGTGTDKIEIDGTKFFGNDTVYLTKGEKLTIDLGATTLSNASTSALKYDVEGKDLVVKVEDTYSSKYTKTVIEDGKVGCYGKVVVGTVESGIPTEISKFDYVNLKDVKTEDIVKIEATANSDKFDIAKASDTSFTADATANWVYQKDGKYYVLTGNNIQEAFGNKVYTVVSDFAQEVTLGDGDGTGTTPPTLATAITKYYGKDAYAKETSVYNNSTKKWDANPATVTVSTSTTFSTSYTKGTTVNEERTYTILGDSSHKENFDATGVKETDYNTTTTAQTSSIVIKNAASKDLGAVVEVVYNNNGTTTTTSIAENPTDATTFDEDDFAKGSLNTTALADYINASEYPIQPNSTKGVKINSGAGNDKILGSKGNDTIKSSSGDNTITEATGKNTIITGAGDDTIYISTITTATTTINVSSDTINTIKAGNGENKIYLLDGTNKVTAGKDKDTVVVTKGTNTLKLGNGLNDVTLNGGTNTVVTGKDADEVEVTSGTNTLKLGNGENNVTLSGGKNTVVTGKDADTIAIEASSLEFSVNAGNGNNIISVAGGYGEIKSGKGNDKYTFTGMTTGTTTDGVNTVKLDGGAGSDLYDLTLVDKANIIISDSKGERDILNVKPLAGTIAKYTLSFDVSAKGKIDTDMTADFTFNTNKSATVTVDNFLNKNSIEEFNIGSKTYTSDDINSFVNELKGAVTTWAKDYGAGSLQLIDNDANGSFDKVMLVNTENSKVLFDASPAAP